MSDDLLKRLDAHSPNSVSRGRHVPEYVLCEEAATKIRTLQSQLKTAREDALEEAAKWHDDEADYNSGVLQTEESDSIVRGFFADALTFHRDSAKELRALKANGGNGK